MTSIQWLRMLVVAEASGRTSAVLGSIHASETTSEKVSCIFSLLAYFLLFYSKKHNIFL